MNFTILSNNMISKKEKITFIAALFFMNVRVDLIGSMSLTELFVLTQIPHLLKWLNEQGKKIPCLKNLTIGFYCLIIVQIIAEFMVHNTFINAAKGIAITIMALFLMLFFIEKLVKDISLIIWIPICKILGLVIFGDQFGFSETGETTYFKFYIAPIIASAVYIITLMKWQWIQRYLFLVLFGTSLFIIIGGARSLGFSMFFTTFALLLYNKYKTIKLKKIIPGLIIAIIASQLFLSFIYMPKVKSGEWGSEQNRSQFEKIKWNSNIFMILFSARTDFFVSTIAFLDKPLWGHGSWAIDHKEKYHLLQLKMLGDKYKKNSELKLVPCHSVVMGKGVSNGIFAFVVFLWIFIKIYGLGLKGLSKKSPYNAYLLWTIISSFQLLLFGPPAILKNNGAIAFVIGGTSAEKNLLTVKLASTHYYDELPTTGNEYGRAFRDVELEKQVLEEAYKIGLGAQFGGKYMAHDVRIIRLPRHGASCPIGLGVSCSADRNIKCKINKDGIWIEKMDDKPGELIPAELREAGEGDVVKIDLNQPMADILKELTKYPVATRLSLNGTIIVGRDIAHAKLKERLDRGEDLPQYIKDHPIYYAGPAKTPEGMACGSMGPTTAGRMDPYVDLFQSHGGSMIMLAKGNRSQQVTDACKKYGGFYLGSIGGPAAILAQNNIKSIECVEYPELGMEAIWKIEVEDFPAFILVDDKGNDFFKQLKPRCLGNCK